MAGETMSLQPDFRDNSKRVIQAHGCPSIVYSAIKTPLILLKLLCLVVCVAAVGVLCALERLIIFLFESLLALSKLLHSLTYHIFICTFEAIKAFSFSTLGEVWEIVLAVTLVGTFSVVYTLPELPLAGKIQILILRFVGVCFVATFLGQILGFLLEIVSLSVKFCSSIVCETISYIGHYCNVWNQRQRLQDKQLVFINSIAKLSEDLLPVVSRSSAGAKKFWDPVKKIDEMKIWLLRTLAVLANRQLDDKISGTLEWDTLPLNMDGSQEEIMRRSTRTHSPIPDTIVSRTFQAHNGNSPISWNEFSSTDSRHNGSNGSVYDGRIKMWLTSDSEKQLCELGLDIPGVGGYVEEKKPFKEKQGSSSNLEDVDVKTQSLLFESERELCDGNERDDEAGFAEPTEGTSSKRKHSFRALQTLKTHDNNNLDTFEIKYPEVKRLSTPDPAMRASINHVMDEFWIIFNERWPAGASHCAQSSCQGSRSSRNPVAYSNTGCSEDLPGKRKRKDDEYEPDENGDGKRHSPSDSRDTDTQDVDTSRKFACHFRKHDSTQYNLYSHRVCALSNWTSIARVK
jgi:hypothetical protein